MAEPGPVLQVVEHRPAARVVLAGSEDTAVLRLVVAPHSAINNLINTRTMDCSETHIILEQTGTSPVVTVSKLSSWRWLVSRLTLTSQPVIGTVVPLLWLTSLPSPVMPASTYQASSSSLR